MFYIVLGFGIFVVAMGSIFFVADVPGAADRFVQNVEHVERAMIGNVGKNNNHDDQDSYYDTVAEPSFPTVVPVAHQQSPTGYVSVPALPKLELDTEARRDIRREQEQLVKQVDRDVRAALQP